MNESNENGFSEENLRRIAALKIKFRLSVKIHLTAYIFTIVLLISINVLFTPFFPWVIFPIFGWLIGLVIHITAYIVYARGVYPIAKRGVIFNTVAYVVVILFLFIINNLINLILNIPFIYYWLYYWAVFPAFFWGLALIIHFIVYLGFYNEKLYEEGERQSRMERAIEKEMHKLRKKSA